MVVSWKSFLEQEQKNPVTQLTTGAKNPTVAPSDTINTSKVKAGQTTQPTGTLEAWNMTLLERMKESITWNEAQRDILNAATTLENMYKSWLNKVKWAVSYVKNAVSDATDTLFADEKAKIEEEQKKINQGIRQEQAEVRTELDRLSKTDKKRDEMLTVVDPYKSQPQYWPFVDYRQARLNVGSIWDVVKNVTLNNDATVAYISNGLTTVSKPVINGGNYQKTLEDAYNAITYEYAHFGNLLTPEIVKQYFPTWKDASDEEIDRFINECAYDVEKGKRRDISMYAENFLDLSMPDWYTSKHDSIIKLYSDDDYLSYGLGNFINGTATLEWKTAEDIKKYISAVRYINKCVETVKENGANTQWASDFVIAKTFADDYEWLREALDIYQNFNLTNKDLATIDAVYTANMEDMKDFAYTPIYDNEVTLIDIFYNHLNEMSKTKILSEAQGNYQPLKTIQDWFMWDVYEADGKFFNAKWEEVPRNEATIWVFKAWLDWLRGVWQGLDSIQRDIQRVQDTPSDADDYFEKTQVPAFDIINTAFRIGIEFTPTWILLWPGLMQAPVKYEWPLAEKAKEFVGTEEAPTIGHIAEAWFEWFFGGLGDFWVKQADMIWYTEWWTGESKQKFWETFAWLATILLAKGKRRVEKAIWRKISNTTIAKSINAMKERLIKEIDVIDEYYERKKIEAKNEINKEVDPKEQVKEQEKMVEEIIDQEKVNRKTMFVKESINNAFTDFRKTFLEEYTKESNAEKKANGESTWPTLIDNLFKRALELWQRMKEERAAEVKDEIDNIEKKTPEVETTTVEEKPTVEWEEVKVETTVEEPGEKVEQTKPATPEEWATGTAKVEEKASQQTKQQIKWILRFIADVLDMWKEIKDYNLKKLTAKLEQRAERKAENQRLVDSESLSEAGLTEEQIRQMQRNPYSETLLDIINSLTKEIKNKRWKITKVKQEESMTPDEIQREVLSRGIERLQQHVNKLVEMRKILWSLYKDLQKKANIDTSKFTESEPLKNVLKDYWYEIEVEIDPETWKQTARVYKSDMVDASPNEQAEMKYIEDFINKQLRFEKKSEADLHKDREWLKWNEDTYGKNGRSKALENSFRDAFNKFIEEQWDVKLLRAIDKWFSNLSDGIDTLRELLNKDNTVKDNAKNKILKWNEAQINELNDVIPGIKDLIDLTRVAPEIVKKGVAAKRMTQATRQKAASVVRYMFVGWVPTLLVPSLVSAMWLTAWGATAVILWSILFKVSENFWLKMKHKIQGTKPDLKLYETFVNNLKITDNQKALYKQKLQKQIEELTKDVQWKTEKEFNDKISEIAEILIDRTANEIAENKLRWGVEPEQPATPVEPKWPKTPTAPELTPEEKQIIKDAAAIEKTEHAPEMEKAADVIEEIKQTVEDAQVDNATAVLEEKGEDVTPTTIQEEIKNPTPKTLAEELGLVTAEELGKKTMTLDIREVPDEMIEKVLEDPEKYGATYDEVMEMLEEQQRRVEMNAMAEIKAQDEWNTSEDAANVEKIRELEQKKADAKTKKQKDAIQKKIDELQQKAIDKVGGKRNSESTFEAEEALNEQADASYNKIEEWRKWLVGKFRQNSYSAQLFSEKYNLGYKKPLSYTSSIENIMEDPSPKTRDRLLQEKKIKLEKKIRESKYPKAKERQMAELEKVNEAIEKNNESLNAIQEKVEIEKQLKEERSKAQTKEEKKELTKKIKENNKELEDILEEMYTKPEEIIETEAKEVVELEWKEHLIDAWKYNPWKVNVASREVKHTNPKEKDIWTDSEWNEVTFYHWTPEWWFEEFSMEHRWESHDLNSYWDYGRWMYFTPFKETAEWYAKWEWKNPEIYETKLKMENPLRLDLYTEFIKALNKLQREDTKRWYSLLSKEHSDNVDRLMKEYGLTEELYEKYEDVISSLEDNRFDVDIRNTEFDWIISEDGKEVIVPDTDQIVMQKHYSSKKWTPSKTEEKSENLNENLDEKIEYNISEDPEKLKLKVYKGVRWYDTTDTAWDENTTFYTNDKARADQYQKTPNTEEQTIEIDKDKVKIIDSKGISRSQYVDENWNIVKGKRVKKWQNNYIDYNNRIAEEEWYEAVIYKNIIDIWPNKHKWAKVAENADDIVLLKKKAIETPKEEVKTEEKKEQTTQKEPEPLVKTDEKGKALEMKWNPTSKEMFERMQEIRKKAKENWGKISFRDRSELEFLMDRYKTKLEEEAKQEYNPTERDDLNREELSNIWWLNVNTYWMDIQ